MIPFELVTMLASGVFSGILTLIAKRMEIARNQHQMTMEALGANRQAWQEARNFNESGISFTRRTIALTVVFSVVLLPKLAALFFPEMQISVGYTEWQPGFWFFTEGHNEVVWRVAPGLALTPLDTHFASAVIGLYFGHKASK